MLQAEYVVYLWIHINIICIYKDNTVNLKFGQQLF